MKKFTEFSEGRCWPGYKPKPGKTPYSDGSCFKESAAAAIAAATAIAKKKSGNYDSKGMRKTPYKNPDSPNRKSNAERRAELKEDLRKWFSKTAPEGGWKRINSKGEAIGPCAREPGEPKPKCMSKAKRASLSKKERASAVRAKRKYDPNPERKGQPINVSNFGKGKLSENMEQLDEKNVPTSPEKWAQAKAQAKAKFDVYPSAYANGWASKKYKEMGGGWKSVSESKNEQEYGYEGDMALNQLATLTRCAEMIKDMLKPDTDMPEWVQSKITLATDYIQTAADYMYSEMKEEVELTEGRPSQRHPLEGHEYHKKTNAELEYIAKDAHKAAEAMKSHNTTAENKYRDQANDSATVRYFRQKNGMPDWYKKKYGHMNESDAYEKDVKPSDKPHDKEAAAKRAKIAAVMARRKMAKEEVEQIDELSNDTLGRYKKAAGADASEADKAGDYAKGNKRFSGILKATRKQFDNDAKKQPLKESRKAEIIKDASKSAKEKAAKTKDKFEADPILSSEIVKEDK